MPADAIIGVEQSRFVNTARAQFGLHLAIQFEAFREKVQPPALFTDFLITLVGFFVELPATYHFAIRHHHQRPAQLLTEAGTAGDVFQYTVAQLLTVLDHAVDHQQWDQQ